jgi:hypothetical protein
MELPEVKSLILRLYLLADNELSCPYIRESIPMRNKQGFVPTIHLANLR